MNDLLQNLQNWWAFILAIGGGIGTYLKWRANRNSSRELLYEQLEKLKKKLIEQVERDIESAQKLKEKEMAIIERDNILSRLREQCPDCYQKYVERYEVGSSD